MLTCEGSDPDGDPVTYLWCIESGKGSFVDPTVLHPTFCAPMTAACDGEDIVVRLTVTDSCGPERIRRDDDSRQQREPSTGR